VELLGGAGECPTGAHWASAPDRAGVAVDALGGMDDAPAGIAGRTAQALLGPCIEILAPVDDAPAQLVIDRTGAIAPVLLERARRQTQMHRRVGCAQESGADRVGNGWHEHSP